MVVIATLYGCGNSNPSGPPVNLDHAPPTTVIMRLIRLDDMSKAIDTTICTIRDTSVVKNTPFRQP